MLSSPLLAATGCAKRPVPFQRPTFESTCGGPQPPLPGVEITAQFLGTTSLLLRDEQTAILSDGFVTRPPLPALVHMESDERLIKSALQCFGGPPLSAVFAGHSHYDHAMDAPLFAKLTGAVLVGSESTKKLGVAAGLPEEQLSVVSDGETRRFGSFEMTFLESRHSPGDRVPGTIEKPFSTPASYLEWKTGTTWSVLVRHGTRTLLLHGSANYEFGALRGRRADVVYLGIGELGKQSEAFIDSYWDETVVRTGARRVILVHWDNFFRGLDEPLEPMPRVLDHVDDAIKQIRTRAAVDKVDVVLPALWERSDPFAGLS